MKLAVENPKIASAIFATVTGIVYAPARAITLGWSSRLSGSKGKVSIRQDLIDDLKNSLEKSDEQAYHLVCGPKGVGKSTFVDTFVHRRGGVIYIKASPNEGHQVILGRALREIGGISTLVFDPVWVAKAVSQWYGVIFRHSPKPLIVIHAAERQPGEEFARLTATVRDLTETFHVNVLVDGSENSLEPGLFMTGRERVISIEPFIPEELESFPQLANFFLELHATKDDVLLLAVKSILGGVPCKYSKLVAFIRISKEGFKESVITFLLQELGDAENVREKMIKDCPEAEALYDQFAEVDQIQYYASKMPRPSPDKVLRETRILRPRSSWFHGRTYLEPATPEMAFYLRHKKVLSNAGTSEKAQWDAISKLVAPTDAPTDAPSARTVVRSKSWW